MSNFTIKDESSNHKYRTELPNLIFELGLSPTAFCLYSAIKRCAGDVGICTRSTTNLAKLANMSPRTLQRTLPELLEINKFIKKSLVNLTPRISDCGDQDTNELTINDIWPENAQYFLNNIKGGDKLTVPPVKMTPGGAKMTGGVVTNCQGGGVKLTDKEEPFKKNPIKKQQQAVVFFDCLVKDNRLDDDKRLSLMRFKEDRIKLALEFSLHVAPTTTLIQQLMWHCALINPAKIPKKNFWDQVKKDFKNEKIYNGAMCYINSEGITFERGITNLPAKFSDPSGREKFEAALKQFGIKWTYQ
jgi:Helix-turn-helix domain